MKELIIGIVIGIIGLWICSKIYCFKNFKEWNKFRKSYLRKNGRDR